MNNIKNTPCRFRNSCNGILQLHLLRNKREERRGTNIPCSRSYIRVTRAIGSFSIERAEKIFLEIAAVTSGATKLSDVVSIQYGYISVAPTVHPLNPSLRHRETAREICQNDGRFVNSPGERKRTTPQGYRMCLREMKFWPVRVLSFSRS